jgi:glycosyltransferase involved in cell wall biosynthesis
MRLKIVFFSEWFSENMGYAENFLPAYLAKLGHEVHLIAGNIKPYFNEPKYNEIYAEFNGDAIVSCGQKYINGFTLHRLPHKVIFGKIYIFGLFKKLNQISPDIVQTFDNFGFGVFNIALLKYKLNYQLFLETHLHASVMKIDKVPRFLMPLLKFIYKNTVGKIISSASIKNYPISKDSAEIAINYFGYPVNKLEICSLGVDVHLFAPIKSNSDYLERVSLRSKLGISEGEIVFIYTGRFTEDKDPFLLARVIAAMRKKNFPVRGLFVGSGTEDSVQKIINNEGSIVVPFVPVELLAQYYRASEVGVWPKQESTSQLDAISCGLPIIVSNQAEVVDRVEGNGLVYVEGCEASLEGAMVALLDEGIRGKYCQVGLKKVKNYYSWDVIASNRERDYFDSILKSG